MKKLLIVLALIFALATPVFAESQIGVSAAPSWTFYNKYMGQSASNLGQLDIHAMVEGANYFGSNGGFGFEYGIGGVFGINMWAGDTKENLGGAAGLIYKVGLGYRFAFSDTVGLALGLGIKGNVMWQNVRTSAYDGNVMINVMDIYGKAAVDFTIADVCRLNLGLSVGGGPIFSTVSILNRNMAQDIGLSNSDLGFGYVYVAPYVAISYVY